MPSKNTWASDEDKRRFQELVKTMLDRFANQESAADFFGIAQSTLCNWRKGKYMLDSLTNLSALAKAYDLYPEEMLAVIYGRPFRDVDYSSLSLEELLNKQEAIQAEIRRRMSTPGGEQTKSSINDFNKIRPKKTKK